MPHPIPLHAHAHLFGLRVCGALCFSGRVCAAVPQAHPQYHLLPSAPCRLTLLCVLVLTVACTTMWCLRPHPHVLARMSFICRTRAMLLHCGFVWGLVSMCACLCPHWRKPALVTWWSPGDAVQCCFCLCATATTAAHSVTPQTRQRVSTSSLEADVSPAGTHTAHGCLLLAYLVVAWCSLTVFSNRVGGVHN